MSTSHYNHHHAVTDHMLPLNSLGQHTNSCIKAIYVYSTSLHFWDIPMACIKTFRSCSCRSINSHWLATYYGLHQQTSFISIWPHSSSTLCLTLSVSSQSDIRPFTWSGLETWSSSCLLDRPTPQYTGFVPANLWR